MAGTWWVAPWETWARAAPGSVKRGAVVFEQRRGGAREAGTAGIGLGGDRAHRGEVVTAGEDGLDGAVVRAVVGECALACGLEAHSAVLILERENALGGPQALTDVVMRDEALGGRRQMIRVQRTLEADMTVAIHRHRMPGAQIRPPSAPTRAPAR